MSAKLLRAGKLIAALVRGSLDLELIAGSKGKSLNVSVPDDSDMDPESCVCSAVISIPLSAPKILMLELVEAIASKTMLRHIPGVIVRPSEANPNRACGMPHSAKYGS